MAAKGVKAKVESLSVLDVPYFLIPALTKSEACVVIPRAITGLISRRREIVPLAAGLALYAFGVTLWIVPAVAIVELVLLWDWAEHDRSGKARRIHSTKRGVQNAFHRCREDRAKKDPIKSLPLYMSHGEYPPRSDPPDDLSLWQKVWWRWQHRHSQPHTTIVTLGLAPAVDDVRLGKIAGQVGKYFHATCKFQNHRNGTAKLTIRYGDVLAQPVPYRALEVTPQAFPVGVNKFGFMVGRQLMDGGGGRSWFVFGMRGAGKSAFLNATIANIVRLPHWELYIVDPLDGVDLELWWPIAKRVAVELDDVLDLLEDFHAAIKTRRIQMRTDGVGEKIVEPTAEYPMRVLLIDELARLTLNPDSKFRNKAIYLIGEINALGRKTADVLIAATQDPRKEIIPGQLQGQFTDRFGFRCDDAIANFTGFGSRIAELANGETVNVAAIPEAHKGRCWVKGGSPIFEELRAVGLWGKDLEVQVSRLARQRQAVGPVLLSTSQNLPALLPADGPGPASQASSQPSEPPVGEGKQSERAKGDAVRLVYEEILTANGVGTTAAEVAAKLRIPRRTVNNSIQQLRASDRIVNHLGHRYVAKETN